MVYWGERLSPVLVNFVTMSTQRKIPAFFILFFIFLLAISNLAFRVIAPAIQTSSTPQGSPTLSLTNTPEPDKLNKNDPDSLKAQAGKSDWIVFFGFVMVVIIIVPMLMQKRNW